MDRSELYALIKMVENEIEKNKQEGIHLENCRQNPAVNMIDLLHKLQDEYIKAIHGPALRSIVFPQTPAPYRAHRPEEPEGR